jgi:hypothetical protein
VPGASVDLSAAPIIKIPFSLIVAVPTFGAVSFAILTQQPKSPESLKILMGCQRKPLFCINLNFFRADLRKT